MKSPQTLPCVYIMYDKFVLGRLADTLCYSSTSITLCFSCFLISNIWGFSWSGTSNECTMLFISIQLQHGCFFVTSFQKILLFFSILNSPWTLVHKAIAHKGIRLATAQNDLLMNLPSSSAHEPACIEHSNKSEHVRTLDFSFHLLKNCRLSLSHVKPQ